METEGIEDSLLEHFPCEVELIRGRKLPMATNLALDHVLAEAIARGERGPLVRLWRWPGTAVVLGSSQSIRKEVDVLAARAHGVQVLRRSSGGGTMFLREGDALAYSVLLPTSMLRGLSLRERYELCDSWVLSALRRMGVPAFYQPLNDIATAEGKISGAAARQLACGVTIHHTGLSWKINTEALLEVTRLFRPELEGRGTTSAQKKVVGVSDYSHHSYEAMIEEFLGELEGYARVREVPLRARELIEAEHLARTHFLNPRFLNRNE